MTSLEWMVRRAAGIFEEEGLPGLLHAARRDARRRLSRLVRVRYLYIYRYPITPSDVERFRPAVDHLEVRVVESPSDCDRIAGEGLEDPRGRMRFVEGRLTAGAVMVAAYVSGKLAYMGWTATTGRAKNSFDRLPYRVDFAGGEAATGGALTLPAFRGLGLYRYVFGHELEYLRRKGRAVCCNAIPVGNYASQRGQAVHGALVCARARHVRILGFERWREWPLSGPCPSVGGHPDHEGRVG